MPRVFLSHSTYDRNFVSGELVPFLREYEIDSWYAPIDIRASDEWERKIVEGLRVCDWFLVVLSPNAATSTWVRSEVSWAIKNRLGRIIPLMLSTCDPSDVHLGLTGIHFVDFRLTDESGKATLLETWGLRLSEGDDPSGISHKSSAMRPRETKIILFTLGPHDGLTGVFSWTTNREEARVGWDRFWAAKIDNPDVRASMKSDDYQSLYISLLGPNVRVGSEEEPPEEKRESAEATEREQRSRISRIGGRSVFGEHLRRIDAFDDEGVGYKEIDESQQKYYEPPPYPELKRL